MHACTLSIIPINMECGCANMQGQPYPIGSWRCARMFLCDKHSSMIWLLREKTLDECRKMRRPHTHWLLGARSDIITKLGIPGEEEDEKDGPLPAWCVVDFIILTSKFPKIGLSPGVLMYLYSLIIHMKKTMRTHPCSTVVKPHFLIRHILRAGWDQLHTIPTDVRSTPQYKSIFGTPSRLTTRLPVPRISRKRKCEFKGKYSK